MKNLIKFNTWNEFNYSLSNHIITKYKLLRALVVFRREILTNIPENYSVFIQLKLKTSTSEYRSISKCFLIKPKELISIIEELLLNLEIRLEAYNQIECTSFIISFRIFQKEVNTNISKYTKNPIIYPSRLPSIYIGGFNLPRTMDLYEWGDVHFFPSEKEAIVYKYRSKGFYKIRILLYKYTVELFYKDKKVVEFTDELLNTGNLSEFKRTFKNQVYYFKDGEVEYKEFTFKKPFIPKIGRKVNHNLLKDFKVITMDLETYTHDGKVYPYASSIYDGQTYKFFYKSDFKNSEDLLRESIIYLMQKKYDGYTVYLHNFSKFDGVFLLKVLTDLSLKINIIMREGLILNITFYYGKNKLFIKDSLLMLPLSLKKLSKQFKVPDKSLFPLKFVNPLNLDYDGPVPSIDNFYSITENQYKNYKEDFKNRSWNLRRETEFYCSQDCLVLYSVLFKFTEEILNEFYILVTKYSTLSSLAFAIFRSSYMKEDQICILEGSIYVYLKQSFRGGYVEGFTPYGINVKGYDVNSLYPYVMRNNKMPVGHPTFFEGDIFKIYPDILLNENKFLFLKVEVESPKDMERPFLLKTQGIGKNLKTVSPLGQ